MDILFIVTYVFFFVWLARNIFFWLFLWQVKEYRLDRILVHLKETTQGKMLFSRFDGLAKLVLILLYLFSYPITDPNAYQITVSLLFCVYLFDFLETGKEVFTRRLRKPIFTTKIICITLFTFLINIFLFGFLKDRFFLLPFLDKLTTIILMIFIGIFSLPSRLYHGFLIKKAMQKIAFLKSLKVIGITGCYGKGSTKEYLATILGESFQVCKTFETQNTPIGIAQTILHELSSKTDIFIVEIGAYKRGETAEIAQLVRPKVAIITPVEDQHLSLFGNVENLKRGTFELIEELSPKSLALFDGNSLLTKELYDQTDGKKINKVMCYTEYSFQNKKITSDVRAVRITVDKFSVSFDVYLKKKKLGRFSAHLLGSHHIENILPGIYLAHQFGMPIPLIQKRVSKIIPWKKTMEPIERNDGLLLVDDTFNSSPGATAAAIRYMKIFEKKKVLVLQPFIELGVHAVRDHEMIGEKIGDACTHLFLTNDNYYDCIVRGLKRSGKNCTVQIAQPQEIIAYVEDELKKDDVVVFEGKEAGISLHRLSQTLNKPIL